MSDNLNFKDETINNESKVIALPHEFKKGENQELENNVENKLVEIRRSEKFSIPKDSSNRSGKYEQSNSSKGVIDTNF